MSAFDCLHVEIHSAGLGIGPDGGVARICQWAGLAIAETGHVVLIAAEILALGSSIELILWLAGFFFIMEARNDQVEQS
jgi:hypothetical protein